jgi:Ribbon-helix-helix protein, copG family
VKKTSVYLTEREIARLAWLAEQQGLSQAQVIRNAISAYGPESGGDRDFRLVGSGAGPGDSIADVSEEELLRGFGE